jgi:hypothetical protein
VMAVEAKMEGSEPGNFLCTPTLFPLLHVVGTDSGTDETQFSKPTDGKPGGNGGSGGAAGRGGNGGSGGSVHLHVSGDEAHLLMICGPVDVSGGRGGQPGRPGEGGKYMQRYLSLLRTDFHESSRARWKGWPWWLVTYYAPQWWWKRKTEPWRLPRR